MEQLDLHRRRPLTLVSAPAGYGKSVLISCWLASCDIPSAWLSLDKNDSNLHLFISYFIAAVETLFPAACRNTQDMLNAPALPPMKVLTTSLLNELGRIEQTFILVLDDYSLIKETTVHSLLADMLKYLQGINTGFPAMVGDDSFNNICQPFTIVIYSPIFDALEPKNRFSIFL